VLAFDTSSQEHAQWTVVMPSDWDAGTVTAQFYWTCAGGSAAQTVRWTIAGLALGNDDAIDAAFGTSQYVDDTYIANGDLHITAATSAITVAGTPAAGELVQFRVTRTVASDNLAGDALLLAVKITFTRS